MTAATISAVPVADTVSNRAVAAVVLRRLGVALLVIVGALVVLGLIWIALLKIFDVPTFIGKTPMDVYGYLFTDKPARGVRLRSLTAEAARTELLRAWLTTVGDAAIGFFTGMLAAIVIAGLFVIFKPFEFAFMPIAMLLRSVPLVAMAPVLLLIFGQGKLGIATIGAIVVLFPALVNIILGLRSASPLALDLIRVNGGSDLKTLLMVRVPTALPALFASVRISVPGAIVGAMLAEWLSGFSGLGGVLNNYKGFNNYSGVWAVVVVSVSTSIIGYAIASVIESAALAAWGPNAGEALTRLTPTWVRLTPSGGWRRRVPGQLTGAATTGCGGTSESAVRAGAPRARSPASEEPAGWCIRSRCACLRPFLSPSGQTDVAAEANPAVDDIRRPTVDAGTVGRFADGRVRLAVRSCGSSGLAGPGRGSPAHRHQSTATRAGWVSCWTAGALAFLPDGALDEASTTRSNDDRRDTHHDHDPSPAPGGLDRAGGGFGRRRGQPAVPGDRRAGSRRRSSAGDVGPDSGGVRVLHRRRVVAGAVGWSVIRAKARNPRRLLTVLVPVVLAVSLVPDVWLGVTRSLPGTSWTGVIALMVMHLAVAACAVTAFRLLLPVATRDGRRH